MSVKSFNQERSSFTPFQSSLQQKQLSLFSRLNLNEHDKNSLEHPMRNFAEYESSDLFSMRSKKRKGSAQIQLKESLPGNRTYLNVSLVGKSSLLHNDIFGHHQHYQDLGLGEDYYDEKKEFSQKSCPVGPSYNFQDEFQQKKRGRQLESQIKPRFHKTKNMLRTIGSYLHKHILHNKRSKLMQEKYFRSLLIKQLRNEQREEKISLQIFQKFQINEDSQYYSNENPSYKNSKLQKTKVRRKSLQKSASQEIIGTKQDSNQKSKKREQNNLFEQKELLIQTETQEKITKFHEWVQSLSVINFADYQRVWSQPHEFAPLYRQICYKYYKQEVVCDVMRSRLTTKQVTLRYLNQFIEGLFNPKQFYRFK